MSPPHLMIDQPSPFAPEQEQLEFIRQFQGWTHLDAKRAVASVRQQLKERLFDHATYGTAQPKG